MKRAIGLLCLLFSSWALSTNLLSNNGAMYDLIAVANLNQGSFTADEYRGVLRFSSRIVYLFPNSPEIIIDGQDVRLNAPITVQKKQWLAPTALLEALQLKAPEAIAAPVEISAFELPWEELELKPKAKGVHIFYRPEGSSLDEASIFLMPFEQIKYLDKDLEQTTKTLINKFNTGKIGKVLYFSVALEPGGLPPAELEFIQGASRYIVENNAGLYSFTGTFPETSIGAIKLPSTFNLKQPIRIVWNEVSADYVFLN